MNVVVVGDRVRTAYLVGYETYRRLRGEGGRAPVRALVGSLGCVGFETAVNKGYCCHLL